MLKGSCLINHEKVYIIYVDSLYKISATDSHLLKILTIMNCRYKFYQCLKDSKSRYLHPLFKISNTGQCSADKHCPLKGKKLSSAYFFLRPLA